MLFQLVKPSLMLVTFASIALFFFLLSPELALAAPVSRKTRSSVLQVDRMDNLPRSGISEAPRNLSNARQPHRVGQSDHISSPVATSPWILVKRWSEGIAELEAHTWWKHPPARIIPTTLPSDDHQAHAATAPIQRPNRFKPKAGEIYINYDHIMATAMHYGIKGDAVRPALKQHGRLPLSTTRFENPSTPATKATIPKLTRIGRRGWTKMATRPASALLERWTEFINVTARPDLPHSSVKSKLKKASVDSNDEESLARMELGGE